MADQRNRYPGAQPFSDDDFSRKVFFGRESAARVLADKILANRMVIVYARSGLGKTSLLQAGVASRLREEGCLPLFARVNDLRNGPFHSVLNTIPGEAARQQVEYVAGLPESLWSFFKTAEFWRQDLLLTPVLVLDQFEELFTLQSEQARADFLDQLSYLTRGVRPPSSTPATEGLSEHPAAVRIVLSLREDYLGFLEEAAEHIPQILDARFRLSPLDLQAAQEAIVGPAAVSDPGLQTRPFRLDRDAVTAILDYLSQRRTRTIGESRRYVEPFQLQLICRRIEQIAAARQRVSGSDLTITTADIGGEAALTQTLRDFYRDAIRSVPDRRGRRACRRLCEEYLISPEGRRLSLEQTEIRRQLDLSPDTLGRLVASRLLRSESRSESTYYELSHDALVEPILAAGQTKSLIIGWGGIGSGTMLFLLPWLLFGSLIVISFDTNDPIEAVGILMMALVVLIIGVPFMVVSVILLRSSARSLSRSRRAREVTLADPGHELRRRGSFVSGLSALFGGFIVVLLGLFLLLLPGVIVVGSVADGALPLAEELELLPYVERARINGIGLDTIVYLVAAAAVLLVGGRMSRWGVYRLAGYHRRRPRTAPGDARSRRTIVYASAKILLAGIALASVVALFGFSFLALQCGYLFPGALPEWVPSGWFNMLVVDCLARYSEGFATDLMGNLLLASVLLLIALPALRRGLATARRTFSRPSATPAMAQPESAEQFS